MKGEKVIWKFPLKVEDIQTLQMPESAEILTIQIQNGQPCLWALVYTDSPKIERTFEIFGTGHSIPYDMGVERKYVATFQMLEGSAVFHIFERVN